MSATIVPLQLSDTAPGPVLDDTRSDLGMLLEDELRANGTLYRVLGYLCEARLAGFAVTLSQALKYTDSLNHLVTDLPDPMYLSNTDIAVLAGIVARSDDSGELQAMCA